MKLLPENLKFDFLGKRYIAAVLSVILIIVSLSSLGVRGLNFGIDFTGGVLIEVGYPEAAELPAVRAALEGAGFDDLVVQHFGTLRDVLIRLAPSEEESSADLSTRVLTALQAQDPGIEMRRVEFVGPQVGDELTEKGGLAMIYALIGILIYVAFRFQWKFALGSVAALAHDVIITLGLFSLLYLPFDLTVLAALLAVIGYSLNDTIVVFDRIRENFLRIRKGTPIDVMNASINQTLARTLMTSLTTLLVLIALFTLGGEVIHGFATALIIGVIVGTYSSVFVASASALGLGVSREDLLPPSLDEDEQKA
ncbi:MAG: protein translocase subunit SecF [Salinisphaeraceae bacterium]|nr:protein translocase subunit SecF [Salinisphaeraceae bacterium]